MSVYALRTPVMLAVVLAYLVIVVQVIAVRQVTAAARRLLVIYAAVGGGWAALDAARYQGWLWPWPNDILIHLSLYSALCLSILFLHLTRIFLRIRGPVALGYWLGALWLTGALVLDANLLGLAPELLKWPGWFIGRTALTQAMLVVGWAAGVAGAALLTLQTYRRTSQPLHRNRLAYWSIAMTLSVAAMAVLLAQQEVAGNLVLVAAGMLAVLGLLTHQLPDVRQALRRAAALLVIGAMAIGLYGGAILLAPVAHRLVPGLSDLAAAVLLAVAIIALANPLLLFVAHRLRRWASGAGYDARKMVGEYSLTIGGILELERLAQVALDLIQGAIAITRGALFVVDPPVVDASQAQFYCLRAVGAVGLAAPSGALLADSPMAMYLTQEYAPLTQYELDLNPRFRDMSAAERVWLQGLSMDVFVPIYASQRWIGLLALGPKVSRHRYFDEDLQLLGTLADQTAVALQNARLVDDLVRLNTEIQEANKALDQANQRLAHLDRIKSDFINVISHELRTPLSILYGYAHILQGEVGLDTDSYHRQLVEGINIGTARMQEIIENMLDVTEIDSQALVLSANRVSLAMIIEQVVAKLIRPAAERNLVIDMDRLASLPPVEADAAALAKVFHHLVVNAVKFTPDGGHITISGRCLEDELSGGAVEIAIRDTGIGIDPRFLDLIFTKFYQMGEVALHSTGPTKFKGGGPGLGLAIARGIVEAHGGRLRAESTGHDEKRLPGSCFIVVLPLALPRELRAA